MVTIRRSWPTWPTWLEIIESSPSYLLIRAAWAVLSFGQHTTFRAFRRSDASDHHPLSVDSVGIRGRYVPASVEFCEGSSCPSRLTLVLDGPPNVAAAMISFSVAI